MKTIYRIAKTELYTLFYSPIAWLVLVVFAFQVNMDFTGLFSNQLMAKSLYNELWGASSAIFSDSMRGLFVHTLGNLYLYLPLLTMGLMSREIKSGSIKLLFSSPITNTKIIFGKYLAMMIYCLMLIGIVFLPVLFSAMTIENFDFPLVLSGLLGLYLLICSYAAIGLFMSCLTSYQVVAAMGTLAVLTVLNFIGKIGQSIDFVREITYWLSISGRSYEFISGLICSEDVIYFLVVIAMFLTFSIFKLESGMRSWTLKRNILNYSGVVLIAVIIGYASSRPALMFYHDCSYTKKNTLSKKSQEVMSMLKGDLKIKTYVNLLGENSYSGMPYARKGDEERFKKYMRFKPDIEMEYVYYYDVARNPYLDSRYPNMSLREKAEKVAEARDVNIEDFLTPEEIKKEIDLLPEKNKFIRQVIYNGEKTTFLRLFNDNMKHPDEAEISAALKRFVVTPPKVGFVEGHGERSISRNRDIDYSAFVNNKWYRYSLMNQGFDGVSISLDKEIPQDISILVIADLKNQLTDKEQAVLNNYIDRGGNMIITGEPERRDILNPVIDRLGVSMKEGVVVYKMKDLTPNVLPAQFTESVKSMSFRMENFYENGYNVAMDNAAALEYKEDGAYKITPFLVSADTNSWIEKETKDFLEEKTVLNPEAGEKEQSYPVALNITRKVNDKEQRILVFGDSDFISNGELARQRSFSAANTQLISGLFEYMSYGEYPIDTRRAKHIDNDMYIDASWETFVNVFFMGLIPLILAFAGGFIWFKRKRN